MIQPAQRRFLLFVTALGAAGLVAPLFNRSPSFSAALYLVASSILSLELVDLAVRLWLARRYRPQASADSTLLGDGAIRPYALVLSVRNLQGELDVVTALLGPYKHRTWIVDDASTDATALALKAAGWRCLAARSNSKKPAALRRLLRELPPGIETVAVLDPDAVPLDRGGFTLPSFEAAILRFQKSGAAACCPRIRIREEGPLVAFQVLECELAFSLGRKGMSPHTITSGVAIYDRRALTDVLAKHSLSVYAEDLENTLLLLGDGAKIDYDEALVVETDGKRRLSGWFSQRVGWSYGLLKVLVERRAELVRIARASPWSFYNFAVYLGLFSVVLLPVKIAGVVLLAASMANAVDRLFALGVVPDNAFTHVSYFAATFMAYALVLAGLLIALRPRLRLGTLLVGVPFYSCYAALHVLPVALGYLNWLSLRLTGRRVFRDHYAEDPPSSAPGAAEPS